MTDTARGGRAAARRVTSAGVADLAERQANGVAALDRALEARLAEIDRAFATRRTQLESRLDDAEERVAAAVETGIAEFKRAASDERRLLHEEAASHLAAIEHSFHDAVRELEAVTSAQIAAVQELVERLRRLERATEDRLRALEGAGD
jgi:TolA-binding protein